MSRLEIGLPCAKPYPQATFLGLPGELRNMIYETLFGTSTRNTSKLQLLLVCRQIYHETGITAFAATSFVVTANDHKLAKNLLHLSEAQKSLIKVIERHSDLTANLCRAIKQNLQPSYLLTESKEAMPILCALLSIDTLTHVFLSSRKEESSLHKLQQLNTKMVEQSHRPFRIPEIPHIYKTHIHKRHTVDKLNEYGVPLTRYLYNASINSIQVDWLRPSETSFSVKIKWPWMRQVRHVKVLIPRYSLSDGKWDTHINTGLTSTISGMEESRT